MKKLRQYWGLGRLQLEPICAVIAGRSINVLKPSVRRFSTESPVIMTTAHIPLVAKDTARVGFPPLNIRRRAPINMPSVVDQASKDSDTYTVPTKLDEPVSNENMELKLSALEMLPTLPPLDIVILNEQPPGPRWC